MPPASVLLRLRFAPACAAYLADGSLSPWQGTLFPAAAQHQQDSSGSLPTSAPTPSPGPISPPALAPEAAVAEALIVAVAPAVA
jgi:hypothetical protein